MMRRADQRRFAEACSSAAAVGEYNPEIPAWVNWTMLAVGVAATAVLPGRRLRFCAAGGFVGGEVGSWIGGKVPAKGQTGRSGRCLAEVCQVGPGQQGAGLVGGAKGAASVAGELRRGGRCRCACRRTARPVRRVPSITVHSLPEDLVSNPKGVYGYTPVEGSEFAAPAAGRLDESGASRQCPERTAGISSRPRRGAWVSGYAAAAPAKKVSRGRSSTCEIKPGCRNTPRRSCRYCMSAIWRSTETSMEPTSRSAASEIWQPGGVIAAGTRSNPTMDILTGIAKVGE